MTSQPILATLKKQCLLIQLQNSFLKFAFCDFGVCVVCTQYSTKHGIGLIGSNLINKPAKFGAEIFTHIR